MFPEKADGGAGKPSSSLLLKNFWTVLGLFCISTTIKLLLTPSYHSTDFEVHRNWLAVTHSRPVTEWYFEETSQWTLDYPPFFAWFEWVLSQFAVLVDPAMVGVENLEYASYRTVMFQRVTVMVSDCALMGGVMLYCSTWPAVTTTELAWSSDKLAIVTILVVLNPGLLIVDHIHFQYNGFLLGLLMISVALIRRGDAVGDIGGAVVFATLLMLKHIFMYAAPLYFVYLLRHYCYQPVQISSAVLQRSSSPPRRLDSVEPPICEGVCTTGVSREHVQKLSVMTAFDLPWLRRRRSLSNSSGEHSDGSSGSLSPIKVRTASTNEVLCLERRFSAPRFLLLGGVVGAIVILALGPVVFAHARPVDALQQLLSRLAPTKRGLLHAYWAPNVWALYAGFDKLVAAWLKIFRPDVVVGTGLLTGGLVGVPEAQQFAVLPAIPAGLTALLSLGSMVPALLHVWRKPHPRVFLPALVYCMTCSFMLGYHVHEKAVLMIVIPLSFAACDSTMDARLYLLLGWIGNVALLPLLFTPDTSGVKPALVLSHATFSYVAVDRFHLEARRVRRIRAEPNERGVYLWAGDKLYLLGLLGLYVLSDIVFPLLPIVGPSCPPPSWYENYVPLHFLARLVCKVQSLPFLPLLLTSVYCGIGMCHCWGLAYKQLVRKIQAIDAYQPSPKEAGAGRPIKIGQGFGRSPSQFDLDVR